MSLQIFLVISLLFANGLELEPCPSNISENIRFYLSRPNPIRFSRVYFASYHGVAFHIIKHALNIWNSIHFSLDLFVGLC